MSQEERVRDFVDLVQRGRSVEAIENFYSDEVLVFENHERARVGKAEALRFEREALLRSAPTSVRARAIAFDTRTGRSFVEWTIRYDDGDGRPMRLDEVAVQTWSGGKIIEERFYYEGVIDEGEMTSDAQGA